MVKAGRNVKRYLTGTFKVLPVRKIVELGIL